MQNFSVKILVTCNFQSALTGTAGPACQVSLASQLAHWAWFQPCTMPVYAACIVTARATLRRTIAAARPSSSRRILAWSVKCGGFLCEGHKNLGVM